MNRIAPTLWRTDQITGETDRSSTLIESRAIDDDANATLKMILETGETDPNAKDPYSLNYRLLEKRINDYAAEESLNFHLLIARLLDNVIVLPIKADSQDTALMIFNTLNDRGLSLSDADIFKAKMYKYAGDGREEFVQAWHGVSTMHCMTITSSPDRSLYCLAGRWATGGVAIIVTAKPNIVR